jgi:hypothetical protein
MQVAGYFRPLYPQGNIPWIDGWADIKASLVTVTEIKITTST